jgi:hypothetical protein
MRASVQRNEIRASNASAADCKVFPRPAEIAASCKWFPGLANSLWSKKPAATVHYLTDEPERTCYEWVRGKFDPPSRVLVRLLRTDQGWRVLEYLMRGTKEPWWVEVRRARAASKAYDEAVEQLSLLPE